MRLSSRRSFAWAFVVAASLSSLPACGPSLSQIEQGKAITTKEAALDDFFKSVVALRGEVDRAEGDRKAARVELVKALGLAETAEASEALEAAAKKAKTLDEAGTALHLELTPDAKLIVLVQKRGKTSEDPEALAKAVEQSVKASLDVARRMGELEQRARFLDTKRTELSTTPAAKSGDAPRELEGARIVLADLRGRATTEAGLASSFVVGLAMALETGGADAALAKFTGKNPRPRPGGGGGGGAAPAGGSPAPKPKPSDDFEP
ncbi:hypothetical protein [Polyangium jinanense]|uniref:DUF4398 domain-containing protein n=1 Tax=Polyangium jinanense TaxID=2829994 RepID=A0A9X3WVU5_9BACT|nr:hypothetical protein [Polyangium jinanense]MDC3953802.1 hypothetical protein [Polyangium jinanense]MDC3979077.1 hypothetical protein [Polyangium jinanense]